MFLLQRRGWGGTPSLLIYTCTVNLILCITVWDGLGSIFTKYAIKKPNWSKSSSKHQFQTQWNALNSTDLLTFFNHSTGFVSTKCSAKYVRKTWGKCNCNFLRDRADSNTTAYHKTLTPKTLLLPCYWAIRWHSAFAVKFLVLMMKMLGSFWPSAYGSGKQHFLRIINLNVQFIPLLRWDNISCFDPPPNLTDIADGNFSKAAAPRPMCHWWSVFSWCNSTDQHISGLRSIRRSS